MPIPQFTLAPETNRAARAGGWTAVATANLLSCLIARGYDDAAIRNIARNNALDFFRRTMG